MTDDKKPEEKPTVEIPAVPSWAVELTRSVKNGFADVTTRLDAQEATLLKVSNEGVETNVRLARVEVRIEHAEDNVKSLEARVGKASIAVRGASQMDMEHEAKLANTLVMLAEEKAKREKLEAESATKADVAKLLDEAAKVQTAAIVDGVLKTPTAQKLKNALVPVLMIAISLIGLKLTAALSKLEERPVAPTVVQVAPVTIYADAGDQ